MDLRCLLFSSNKEMVESICQLLPELGIEGEYCASAVDAVEKVTTQLFQIVVTDWDDQPEAAFLLKTARDLKAAQRPLTLAIVSDEGRPEALQAGANSILLKPIRPEQVRDTMTTACQLLRSRQQPATHVATMDTPSQSEGSALAAVVSGAPVPVATSDTQEPQKLRAGEFLQTPMSRPGAQFDTESAIASMEAPAEEVEALTELEPTAAAVESVPAPEVKPDEPLTGWASLQARLTKNAPPPPIEDAPKGDLLTYDQASSHKSAVPEPALAKLGTKNREETNSQKQNASEAASFSHMDEESEPDSDAEPTRSFKGGKVLLYIALIVCASLAAVPRTRQASIVGFRSAVRSSRAWINPAPAPLPQAVAQHDSFGLSGDEYKMPATGNIPDATTDASAIRVVPVIDPTAKPDKNAAAQTAGQLPGTQGEGSLDQSQNANPEIPQTQVAENNPAARAVSESQGSQPSLQPSSMPLPSQPQPPPNQIFSTQSPVVPVRASAKPQAQSISASMPQGIPPSLRSQIASSVPDASGSKPVEAAMSSIEPVKVAEPEVRNLLIQGHEPDYPLLAKGSGGQGGSVVLQVLIGRDGSVQDAKFLQGSLVFARAAIEAVKQWHYRPYSMNGHPVSVESQVTLNFKPPS